MQISEVMETRQEAEETILQAIVRLQQITDLEPKSIGMVKDKDTKEVVGIKIVLPV